MVSLVALEKVPAFAFGSKARGSREARSACFSIASYSSRRRWPSVLIRLAIKVLFSTAKKEVSTLIFCVIEGYSDKFSLCHAVTRPTTVTHVAHTKHRWLFRFWIGV